MGSNPWRVPARWLLAGGRVFRQHFPQARVKIRTGEWVTGYTLSLIFSYKAFGSFELDIVFVLAHLARMVSHVKFAFQRALVL